MMIVWVYIYVSFVCFLDVRYMFIEVEVGVGGRDRKVDWEGDVVYYKLNKLEKYWDFRV